MEAERDLVFSYHFYKETFKLTVVAYFIETLSVHSLKKATFHRVQIFRCNVCQFLIFAPFTFFLLRHVHLCQSAMKKVLGKTFIQKCPRAVSDDVLFLMKIYFSKLQSAELLSIEKIKSCNSLFFFF